MESPIICALDTKDLKKAISLTKTLDSYLAAVKLGLEFFSKYGPKGVHTLYEETGVPIFLDLKLHDIPHTVFEAISALSELNLLMVTLHLSGGNEMVKSAKAAVDKSSSDEGGIRNLLGVTMLTSMEQAGLDAIGVSHGMSEQVSRLVNIAATESIEGVVCASEDVAAVKTKYPRLLTVVPGIRNRGEDRNDQKRVSTASEAIKNGADYLVIGRSITAADNPKEAILSILESITAS